MASPFGRSGYSGFPPSAQARPRAWVPMGSAPSPVAVTAKTARELEAFLAGQGVDTSSWGRGEAKSVGDLVNEITKGESRLEVNDGVVRRRVEVLSVAVTRADGKVLYEALQTLPDGRQRCRNMLLAEKLQQGETWQEAIRRAVKEELGSALTSPASVSTIAVLEDSYCSSERVEEAHSYPGIQCLYRVHHAAVRIDDLPADDFDTWEPREGGRLVTRWQWRDVEA